jgi:hypothetical protein
MALVDKDNGWKKFQKTLGKMGGMEVVVGIPGEGLQVDKGFTHEFGSADGDIPERSFIRSTFDVNEKKYAKIMEDGLKKQVKTGQRDASMLFKLGEVARGDVINRIRNQEIKQDLAPATLEGKAPRTKALIDSGAMVGSIVSEVRKVKK